MSDSIALTDAAQSPSRWQRELSSIVGARWELLPILLLVGFVVPVYLNARFTFWTPGMAQTWMIAPLAVLALALTIAQRDVLAWLAGLLAVSVITSSALSDAPVVALIGAAGRWNTALVFVTGLGCWALAQSLSESSRLLLLKGFVVAAGLSGAVGVAQMIVKPTAGLLMYQFDRPSGFASNPVYLAGHVAAAAAYFAYRYAHSLGRSDLLGFTLFAFFTALTSSRIATAGLMVILVAVLIVARRRTALLAVLGFAIANVLAEGLQQLTGSTASTSERLTSDGLGLRLDMWRFGLRAWVDRPILGYGAGRFRAAAQRYYSDSWVYDTRSDDALAAWFDSHNIFVQVLVCFGVIGLLLFGAFIIASARRGKGPGLWMFAALLATWQMQPAVVGTWPVAFAALGAATTIDRDGKSIWSMQPAPLRRGLVALAGVSGLVFSLSLVVGDRRSTGASVGAPDRLPAAMWMFARDPVVANGMANAHFDPAEFDPTTEGYVVGWLRRATEYEPDFPLWWSELALKQVRYGNLDAARVAAEQAIALQPNHNASWIVMRLIAQQTGDDALLQQANEVLCRFGMGACAIDAP